ncbi:MAG: 4-(cytidine 5'-diphospho)-2-C-methyl-D-erythritol kinase [Thermovirgaceae bacterium]
MSQFVLQTPAKLNLTLRVLHRRKDGFHNIVSTFFRLPVHETLTITPVFEDSSGNDHLQVHGEKIGGRNILFDVLAMARTKGVSIPSLAMELWKTFPPGAGTAAGSGNASALAGWLEETWGMQISIDELAKLGSDVPFLRGHELISLRGGVGEIVLEKNIPLRRSFSILVMIPDFASDTAGAYAALDQKRKSAAMVFTEEEASAEARRTIQSLQNGETVGLLPNDFTDVLISRHSEYERVFGLFRSCGARCWGITGSGSGCFAFFDERHYAAKAGRILGQSRGIRKIFIME